MCTHIGAIVFSQRSDPVRLSSSAIFLSLTRVPQPTMDPNPSVNESADSLLFTPEQLQWIDQLIMSRQSQSLPSTDSELSQSSSASHVPTSAGPHTLTTAASQSGKCVIGLVHLVSPAISE